MGTQKHGQTVGCIPPPKSAKPHKCRMPWELFPWNWFLKDGTLYRCRCGSVYVFVSGLGIKPRWKPSTTEKWEEAGGTRT
jgi:hypothetical protein